MSDPIQLPLDEDDRSAEPPLLDYFHEEPAAGGGDAVPSSPGTLSLPCLRNAFISANPHATQKSDAHRVSIFWQLFQQLLRTSAFSYC